MSKVEIEGIPPQSNAWRSVALVIVSAALVYSFVHFKFVDGSRVRMAFSRHWDLLGLNALCLLLLTAASTLRHRWLLSTVSTVPWRAVVAANVLGLALGQWAPGSAAVAELVRLGLLLGIENGEKSRREQASQVTMISAVDRAVGVGVMFCCGAVAAGVAAVLYPSSLPVGRFIILAVLSLLLGVFVLWIPLYADAAPTQRVIAWLRTSREGFIGRTANTAASVLHSASSVSKILRQRPGVLIACILLSIVLNAFGPVAYYLTSLALDKPIPFLLIAAILPTTIVAALLPIGFAGFGGPQLVAMTNFAAFGVPSEHVLEMTLVQSTLTLAVQTILGLCWGVAYGSTVRSLLRGMREGRPRTPITDA